jgi:HlyD family type I secretion membrane fusion protein
MTLLNPARTLKVHSTPPGQLLIARFRSETDALSQEKEPALARATLFIVTGAIIFGFILAGLVSIDRVVTGTGQLVTQEPTVVVQSLNRAIIKSINVKAGDRVKAGDVLATLDSTFAAADVAQLHVQIESLDAEIARLQAERDQRPFTATSLSERYGLLQQSLYLQRQAQRTEQLKSLESKIAQFKATIVKYTNEQKRYGERAKVMSEVESMRRQLAQQQVGSRLTLLQAMDQRLEVLRYLDFGTNALVEAQHQHEAAQSERDAFIEQWRTQVNVELIQKQTIRDATAEQLAKAQKTEDLVNLYAPTDAVVLQVAKLSVGSVLTEASPLFTLVPMNAAIEAEISIDARDIGFIRTGDRVAVKLEAYNYLQHGYAEGQVKVISEDAFTTAQDGGKTAVRPFYKATIVLDKTTLHNVPEGFRLIPGMPLTGDVIVGDRTLLSYLSHGFLRSLNEAMREP